LPKSVEELIMKFFEQHPKQDWKHGPVVDWVTKRYKREHSSPPRDPWRAIRKLSQQGFLIKVTKGIYRYDPRFIKEVALWDFAPRVKAAIFERDGHKCVICGRGKKEGVELIADHIKPKDLGGTNDLENGQTLYGQHNLIKKNYSQTEAGKRYFIKMYERAARLKDRKMMEFCEAIFDSYDKFQIDEQISRPDK